MYYVYVIQSVKFHEKYYTGFTENIDERLKCHNGGSVFHTAKYRPWKMLVHISFVDKQKALNFERYLKSHSGRAFAVRHF